MKSTTVEVEVEPCVSKKPQPYEPALVGKYICNCFDCRNVFLVTEEELACKWYANCPDCGKSTKATPAWTFTGAIEVYAHSCLYKKWTGQCSACNKVYVIPKPQYICDLPDCIAQSRKEVYEKCSNKVCGGDVKYIRCHSEEGKALLSKIGQSLLPGEL